MVPRVLSLAVGEAESGPGGEGEAGLLMMSSPFSPTLRRFCGEAVVAAVGSGLRSQRASPLLNYEGEGVAPPLMRACLVSFGCFLCDVVTLIGRGSRVPRLQRSCKR